MGQAILLLLLLAAETTIVSTSVIQVDRTQRTITVADAVAGGAQPRRLDVAPSAAAALARLRPGTAVVLTMSGATVIGIQLAGRPAPAATSNVPQLPPGSDAPQARPIPQLAPDGGTPLSPSPGVSPVSVRPTRPAVSPVAVRSPRSPGTPKPVVLPSDPPPTPIPSPRP